ncbi:MAG: hypothetical protein JRG83_21005 [Deltaproteobacteria bacterium]|nr:hypothetical protein [Deltaproteobacteria bacterium]
MARRSRMSVQKRKRERDKAERASMKREERSTKEPREEPAEGGEALVATESDLEGYGLGPEPEEEEAELT